MPTKVKRIPNSKAKKSIELAHSFCALPFKSLSIESMGHVVACCENVNLGKNTKGKPALANSSASGFLDLINSDHLKKIRAQMLRGVRPESCSRCWNTEDAGGYSFRNLWNDQLKDKTDLKEIMKNTGRDGSLSHFAPVFVEMALGNKCNLKCRMCSVYNSTTWLKEATDLWEITADKAESLRDINWFKDPNFKNEFSTIVENIEYLNFWGGEPLIIPEHFELLKSCVEKKASQRIALKYATNLTYLPDSLLEIWKHFKQVWISVSIDGYENLNEYIRFPSKWSKLNSNLDKLILWRKEINLSIGVTTTFQILNITRLNDFYPWVFDKIDSTGNTRLPHLNWVSFPVHMNPLAAPKELKQLAYQNHLSSLEYFSKKDLNIQEKDMVSKLRSHLERLIAPVNPNWQEATWRWFCKKTSQYDRYRKQSIFDYLPEYRAFYKDDGN